MIRASDVLIGDTLRLAAGDGLVVRIEPLVFRFRPDDRRGPPMRNIQVIPAGNTPTKDHYGGVVGARWLGFWDAQQVPILTKGSRSPALIVPEGGNTVAPPPAAA